MKKLTFSLWFCMLVTIVNATTWTITNSAFTFSPSTITIEEGDTVIFNVAATHVPIEVSQATWNANGNTPLGGGFSLPSGGGMLLPDQLQAGTHYYVCQPHASMGMKGTIIVDGTSAIQEILPSTIAFFPNPTDGKFNVSFADSDFSDHYDVEVYDLDGKMILARKDLDPHVIAEIDLSNVPKGMYIVKVYLGKRSEAAAGWTREYEERIVIE